MLVVAGVVVMGVVMMVVVVRVKVSFRPLGRVDGADGEVILEVGGGRQVGVVLGQHDWW